jgi:RNA polymerase sigma factor (sigma-70 family)
LEPGRRKRTFEHMAANGGDMREEREKRVKRGTRANGKSHWMSADRGPEVMRAAQSGDARARSEVVGAFMPLIGSVAKRYRSTPGVDREELMHEGVVGLLTALDRFDPDLGTPFWAYASWWVRQAMQRLVAELGRPVVLSDRALRRLAELKAAQRKHMLSEGREPSIGELARLTDTRREEVESLMAVDRPARSLEEPMNGDDGTLPTLGERIGDPVAEDDYERVQARAGMDPLHCMDDALGERDQHILRARYGLDRPPQTLKQVADPLGLSTERVRQLEDRALDRLRVAVVASAGANSSGSASEEVEVG